jgi:hypothetical protein
MKTNTSDFHQRLKYRAVTELSVRPALYYGARRMFGKLDKLCISPETNIVIEGYPRSANSTTVQKFISRQNRPISVAHHKHHAAQILRAVDWGIPAVALIREPHAACLSLMALQAEARVRRGQSAISHLHYHNVFRSYIAFYASIEPHLGSIIIAPFDSVTKDVGPMIEQINAKFETDFEIAEMDDDASVALLGWHAMPNELRIKVKQDIETGFETMLSTSARLRNLTYRAEALYERIVSAQ